VVPVKVTLSIAKSQPSAFAEVIVTLVNPTPSKEYVAPHMRPEVLRQNVSLRVFQSRDYGRTGVRGLSATYRAHLCRVAAQRRGQSENVLRRRCG
jgi:hypothetical protein